MIVDVVLDNRYARFTGKYPKRHLRKYFRYKKPNSFFIMQAGYSPYAYMLKNRKVGTGLFLALYEKIEAETKIEFNVEDLRTRLTYREVDLKDARPYQEKAIRVMQRRKSGGIFLAATRTGKTYIAAKYFKSLIGTGLFVVDQLDLLDQTVEEFEKHLKEKVGRVGEGEFTTRRITVATIQTLSLHSDDPKFLKWWKAVDVEIIDELHEQINDRNFRTVKAVKPKLVFGLTATLELKKENVWMNAFDLCGPVVFEYSIEQGTKESYLTPGIVISLTIQQRDSEIDDYQTAYRELITESNMRNHAIAAMVREAHRRGRFTILLVERVRHVKILSSMLEDIPHGLAFGEKKVVERHAARKDFDDKKIRLIIANKVFRKGLTIKRIDTIIEGSAMKSKNNAQQKYGRGIGLCDDKQGMIYFDISDRQITGLKQSDKDANRFSKATGSRIRAFKEKGITVHKIDGDKVGLRQVFDDAELLLEKEILRIEKLKSK